MIQVLKKLFSVALLTTIATMIQANCNTGILTGSPYFFTRSQSRNKVLQDISSTRNTHVYALDSCYNTFDATLSYEKSFNKKCIIDALFAPARTSTVCLPEPCKTCDPFAHCARIFKIQGSAVSGRDPNAWFADYFYLPTDFNSTITFNPTISNTLIFLDYFQGFNAWLCGAYFRIYGPITFSRWDLNFCEDVISRGTMGYLPGYFNSLESNVSIFANTLLENFSSYAIGDVPAGIADTNDAAGSIVTLGINPQPLKYAKLRKESHKKTGFADLRFELGWDFWQSHRHHIGVNIQGAAPTGNKPDPEFCFQPVVGNGKHWELGGGMTGHYNLLWNEAGTKIFSLWWDANFTHLFKNRQQRTFDLKNKPISRYMLAERLGAPVADLFANTAPAVAGVAPDGGVAPNLQFQAEFAPIANLTTMDVNVNIGLQNDIVVWFNLIFCDWSIDLGYNYWSTSCEKIDINKCNDCKNQLALCNASQTNTWALKGDAQVYGFQSTTPFTPIPLSATESGATITGGTNVLVGAPINNLFSSNAGVDNARFAQVTATGGASLLAAQALVSATTQVQTSFQPVTLSCNDIDFTRNKGLTHKVFAHASYTWDCECWAQYLGIGGSAEFSPCTNRGCCPSTCPTQCSASCSNTGNCVYSAASLWSVWIKGGISFN